MGEAGEAGGYGGRRFASHDCSSPEEKYFDVQGSSATAFGGNVPAWTAGGQVGFTTGTNGWLSSITQGSGGNQRTGNVVRLHSIDITGFVNLATTPTGANQYVRIFFFYDRENDGVVPTPAEVLQDTSAPLNSILSPLNISNTGRFQLIGEKRFTLYSLGTTTGERQFFQIHKALKCIPMEWDTSNTNVIGASRNNHIFWFAYYVSATTTTAGVTTYSTTPASSGSPQIDFWARIRFLDG